MIYLGVNSRKFFWGLSKGYQFLHAALSYQKNKIAPLKIFLKPPLELACTDVAEDPPILPVIVIPRRLGKD
jgi:hypothetical protein